MRITKQSEESHAMGRDEEKLDLCAGPTHDAQFGTRENRMINRVEARGTFILHLGAFMSSTPELPRLQVPIERLRFS